MINPISDKKLDDHLVRGGYWRRFAKFSRVSAVYHSRPDFERSFIGFRIVRSKQ